MAILEAYFDASGVSDPARVLSVAAYLLESDACKALHKRWTELLHPFFGGLPENKRYFRMSDFKARVIQPYSGMNEAERLSLHRDLLDAANEAVTLGVLASVKRQDFDGLTDRETHALGNPYMACSVCCMDALGQYLSKEQPDSTIAFFFASGDPGQGELYTFINRVAGNAELAEHYRYNSQASAYQHDNHALGAADMLAWEYRTAIEEDILDQKTGTARVFFNVMLQKPMKIVHLHPANLSLQAMIQFFLNYKLGLSDGLDSR